MKKSRLTPFLKPDLDLLFVGLNPANGSNDNGHYFSVNQSFWNQLLDSGLITQYVDKCEGDDTVFGDNSVNFKKCIYGITDLVTEIAESNSKAVKPNFKDCLKLKECILQFRPRVVIILHGKVLRCFLKYLGLSNTPSNSGNLGALLSESPAIFFNVAFPHGNSIPSHEKVKRYKEIKKLLRNIKGRGKRIGRRLSK